MYSSQSLRLFRQQVLDIVRAAESLALGTHLSDASDIGHPPKSPADHVEDKMHKTTTVVMSAHTLDTQPQVCSSPFSFRDNFPFLLYVSCSLDNQPPPLHIYTTI